MQVVLGDQEVFTKRLQLRAKHDARKILGTRVAPVLDTQKVTPQKRKRKAAKTKEVCNSI
jgi:hypothetical protein